MSNHASGGSENRFTPALGHSRLTGMYDLAVRLLTRERAWRGALLAQIAPVAGDTILDVGCGTGSLALMLKNAAPDVRVIGLDPDPDALKIAARKANDLGADVEWRQGFATDAALFSGTIDKAVSSLVFHQVPLAEKALGIAAMWNSVRPGGQIHIADYARQPTWLMRSLFRHTVQRLDGLSDTQPNADGVLEMILSEIAGCGSIVPTKVIGTPSGAISIFRANRA